MSRYLIGLMMLAFLALPSWSQEDNAGDASGAETDAREAPDSTEPEEPDTNQDDSDEQPADDADLDLQTYEEDEDDFVPTEEIPADEPIPFPSNI